MSTHTKLKNKNESWNNFGCTLTMYDVLWDFLLCHIDSISLIIKTIVWKPNGSQSYNTKTCLWRILHTYISTVGSLYLLVYVYRFTHQQVKNIEKIQKKNVNLPCTSNYLHRFSILLGIISDLEIIWSIFEGVL